MKRRNVYHIKGLTDLEKFREEAGKRLKGDTRDGPIPTTIHHHRVLEVCKGHQHDYFNLMKEL